MLQQCNVQKKCKNTKKKHTYEHLVRERHAARDIEFWRRVLAPAAKYLLQEHILQSLFIRRASDDLKFLCRLGSLPVIIIVLARRLNCIPGRSCVARGNSWTIYFFLPAVCAKRWAWREDGRANKVKTNLMRWLRCIVSIIRVSR